MEQKPTLSRNLFPDGEINRMCFEVWRVDMARHINWDGTLMAYYYLPQDLLPMRELVWEQLSDVN